MPRPIPPYLIAQLVHPEDARLSANSHKKVEWLCDNPQHPTWFASVASRYRSGSGCPYCSGRKAVPGVNDLATLYPEYAAMLVNSDDAVGVTPRSGKKLKWQCSHNSEHTWFVSPHYRLKTTPDSGCPQCSRSKRWVNNPPPRKLVRDEHPEILHEAVDSDAVGALSCGSGKKVRWVCQEYGHEYTMAVRKKVSEQSCPVCAGKQVIAGFNDVATLFPDIAATAVDTELMRTVSRGSEMVVQWRCTDNPSHIWSSSVYTHVIAGNGCPHCNEVGTSKIERRLYDAVRVLNSATEHRKKCVCDGKTVEFDIVAGSLAIEVNGLYWHSEATGKSYNYHQNKTELARKCGYNLLHVWEDQLNMHPGLVLSMIAYRLHALDKYDAACDVFGVSEHLRVPTNVYNARELDVVNINGSEAAGFMNQYHIQGAVNATHHYALCTSDKHIVAVLSLRAPGSDGWVMSGRNAGQWDIVRYATAGLVRGGFGKLLHHAEQTIDVDSWVTFSANDVSDGNLYQHTGFEKDGIISPDYWYTGGIFRNRRISNQRLQKKYFKTHDKLTYEDGWTEHEAALNNNLYRIYDAGKIRWVKKVTA